MQNLYEKKYCLRQLVISDNKKGTRSKGNIYGPSRNINYAKISY